MGQGYKLLGSPACPDLRAVHNSACVATECLSNPSHGQDTFPEGRHAPRGLQIWTRVSILAIEHSDLLLQNTRRMCHLEPTNPRPFPVFGHDDASQARGELATCRVTTSESSLVPHLPTKPSSNKMYECVDCPIWAA